MLIDEHFECLIILISKYYSKYKTHEIRWLAQYVVGGIVLCYLSYQNLLPRWSMPIDIKGNITICKRGIPRLNRTREEHSRRFVGRNKSIHAYDCIIYKVHYLCRNQGLRYWYQGTYWSFRKYGDIVGDIEIDSDGSG